MRFLPVALTGVLLALCFAALAARGPVCDRKHHHPRAIYNADHCAHSLHAPKVALLFLTRGPLPFESVWRRWFHEVAGLAYTGCADGDHDHVQLCGRDREADPIAQQHMYTVLHVSIALFIRTCQDYAELARLLSCAAVEQENLFGQASSFCGRKNRIYLLLCTACLSC